MSERETALQITERIIREHDMFCVGHYLPDAAWCSCAPSDEPLCDSCRALAEKITEAIDAAASLPPDAAPQTCEWREIATAPKDGTRVLLWVVPTNLAMPFAWDGERRMGRHPPRGLGASIDCGFAPARPRLPRGADTAEVR